MQHTTRIHKQTRAHTHTRTNTHTHTHTHLSVATPSPRLTREARAWVNAAPAGSNTAVPCHWCVWAHRQSVRVDCRSPVVMSYINAPCQIWMRHVTCACVLSYMIEPRHAWTSHLTYACVWVVPHLSCYENVSLMCASSHRRSARLHCCSLSLSHTLQYTATHCNILVLQETHWHWHCNRLQHTATHCNTLQHIATRPCLLAGVC